MGSYYRAAMTSGKASYHEAIAQDAPFTGRWHGTHLRPFAKGLLVTIKDITHRKRSEEALLAQKAYSDKLLAERNAILESISDYFLILDRDWKIIYANDNIADFLDTTNTELIGQYFWDVSNIAVGHPLLESYQRAMYSGHPQHIETESSYRPGQYLDVHSYPYAGGLVIYARDISVRKILEHRLTQTLEDKEAILNSISDLMVCLDSNWCFTYANQHGQHYLPKDFLGKHYFEVYPDNQDSIFVQSYQQVLTKQQPITFEAQGSISGRWLEHRVYPYQGGIIIYATNIDERKQLEQDLQATLIQKDMLMKELHHRTTNNLQLVASMLAIQARQLTDESAKAALQNSQNRIHTLAEIHAMLYRQDASTLDTASYLKLLAENVIAANSTSAVRLECHLVPLDLPLEQTIALGLIANELITNALKHAFTDPHENDTIGLLLEQDSSNVGGNVIFIVYNNGKPLKHDQNPSPTSNSLGMTIIQALSRQLDGHFELFNAPDDKVVARVCFTV